MTGVWFGVTEGSIQMHGRDWRGGAAVPEEWSGLGPAEPRKAHTWGIRASFTEHLYNQESAAKRIRRRIANLRVI